MTFAAVVPRKRCARYHQTVPQQYRDRHHGTPEGGWQACRRNVLFASRRTLALVEAKKAWPHCSVSWPQRKAASSGSPLKAPGSAGGYLLVVQRQSSGTDKMLASLDNQHHHQPCYRPPLHMSDCRRPSHPDCRATSRGEPAICAANEMSPASLATV